MPSSKAALTARIAELQKENTTLRMEIGALENILAYYNGSFEEMKKLIETMPGGLVASIGMVLGRHGFLPVRPESSPWQ